MKANEALHNLHLNVHIRKKSYHNAEGRVVLQDIAFGVEHGKFLSILGPSGCGKTTLMRLIAGLDLSVDGDLAIDGKRIEGPGPDRSLVFQERRVLGWRTVAGNIRFALPSFLRDALDSVPDTEYIDRLVLLTRVMYKVVLGRHSQRQWREKTATRVTEVLEMVGLGGAQNMWPYQLSGGMERRLAIARAVVNHPQMLLLDEPLAGLDPFAKEEFLSLIEKICTAERMTGIMVTHDVDDAIMISDKIVVLNATPARVAAVIEVDIPRPRRPTAREFLERRRDILEKFLAV